MKLGNGFEKLHLEIFSGEEENYFGNFMSIASINDELSIVRT